MQGGQATSPSDDGDSDLSSQLCRQVWDLTTKGKGRTYSKPGDKAGTFLQGQSRTGHPNVENRLPRGQGVWMTQPEGILLY